MRKTLFLLLLVLIVSLLGACHTANETPPINKDKVQGKDLRFKVENIVLSKGFQSIEPSIEIQKKAGNVKLLASLGVIESSGVTVDKITKSADNVNIYINRLMDEKEVQLAVPQILIDIKSSIKENPDDLHFNIINQNYEPIHLKFNRKQILNNISSQFQIASNTLPTVTLNKLGDEIIWDMAFQNIFDKGNYKSPLINLHVKANALSGEIIESQKENISNYIDDGYLLDYIPNNYLLYKKQAKDGEDSIEVLWVYNRAENEKRKLYTSKGRIQSAFFSPENQHIAVLEINDNSSDIYIISKENKVASKITTVDLLSPRLIKWYDDQNLYFINQGENRSSLISYNLEKGEHKQMLSLNFSPLEFDILDDEYLFVEKVEDTVNNRIILAKDSKFEKIDTGFNGRFFDKNTLVYLKNMEKEDRNILQLYDIKEKQKTILEYNVSNFFPLNDEEIGFIEKNSCNSDYTMFKYNIPHNYSLTIANLNSDKIFYNRSNNTAYMSLNPPSEENKNPLIYSVDLNKLSLIE